MPPEVVRALWATQRSRPLATQLLNAAREALHATQPLTIPARAQQVGRAELDRFSAYIARVLALLKGRDQIQSDGRGRRSEDATTAQACAGAVCALETRRILIDLCRLSATCA